MTMKAVTNLKDKPTVFMKINQDKIVILPGETVRVSDEYVQLLLVVYPYLEINDA